MHIPQLGLRVLQLFFTVVVMALVGNMIHDSSGGDPAVVNFTMFVVVLSALSLVYLFLVAINETFVIIPQLPFALDALNTIFFFIAAVALAAKLGVHRCSNVGYVNSNSVTRGSPNNKKRCHEAQASDAFLWFGFAAYAASLLFSALGMRTGGGGFRKGTV